MKHLRVLLSACFSAALLAACAGNNGLSSSTPMSVAPQIAAPLSQSHTGLRTERAHVRPAYSVLYSFKGGTGDGAFPDSGLINVSGTLYGTTLFGGSGSCTSSGFSGCGTVFAITTSGTETWFYSFAGGSGDGESPTAGLLNVKGTLYGTTYSGGAYTYCAGGGCGTVFKITLSGVESLLYTFGGPGDGANPRASLINVKGKLDGTTEDGGHFSCSGEGCGAEFSITTSGYETAEYSFDHKDGAFPAAALVNVRGMLYGTTTEGGTIACASEGCGTVFSVTKSGTENVLHSFGAKGDGDYPYAGLVNVKGTLYGTTYLGGAKGKGTVFSITPSGKETILHSFKGAPDGLAPVASVTVLNGTFYGTTKNGGTGKCKQGCGTVFAITPSGRELVLHSFSSRGGKYPQAGLISVNGTLYGTTTEGGANGDGTVFSLSP